LAGAITARAKAQVVRLALIYSLLDLSPVISRSHLMAALAVWEYCKASARWIFGDALGDPIADELLRGLRASPEGLTRTQLSDLLGRNRKAGQIGSTLAELLECGRATVQRKKTDGRDAEVWFAT
jgi:hypothetical protein